jgi:uncharacterized membrane protein
MNDAHLHLLVNHFPIIVPILGIGILIAGMVLKNNSLKNTAYILFIVSAIFAISSMVTGDGAEEIVEKLPEVTKGVIHEHEEMAEKLAITLYALGILSIFGLYLTVKNKEKANWVAYAVLLVAAVGLFLGQQTGATGGEIRHTEIRNNPIQDSGEAADEDND